MNESKKELNSYEYKAIGERLKELRKAKDYKNYEHIAYELEMSRSVYWKLEKWSNFEIKTLIKVCRLLNITLAHFFEGIDLPNDKNDSI